jgi:hypothetical protein
LKKSGNVPINFPEYMVEEGWVFIGVLHNCRETIQNAHQLWPTAAAGAAGSARRDYDVLNHPEFISEIT